MKGLKKIWKVFGDSMEAAAFAEAGEFDTAREIMRGDGERKAKSGRKQEGYRHGVPAHAAEGHK